MKIYTDLALTQRSARHFKTSWIQCSFHSLRASPETTWEALGRGESCACERKTDTDRDAECSDELSLPCEPGMNPVINELKIKQRAVGGKMQNSIRQTTQKMKALWNRCQTVRQVSSSFSAAEDLVQAEMQQNATSSDRSADMTGVEAG